MSNKKLEQRISDTQIAISKVGASPVSAQITFLKELMEQSSEAREFQANPKKYAIEHGILLDPSVVEIMVSATMGSSLDLLPDAARYGAEVQNMLEGLRSQGTVAAWPAAVAAGAAVVAAGAAVVTMVVTLVRAGRLEDLAALRGLGPEGIRMPVSGVYVIGN